MSSSSAALSSPSEYQKNLTIPIKVAIIATSMKKVGVGSTISN